MTQPAEIDVFHLPHPFRAERTQHKFSAGMTLGEIAESLPQGSHSHLHAFIDGHYIARENWARVKPKAGTVIVFRATPMGGGGGKNPFRTIMSMAISNLTGGLGTGILGMLGGAGPFGLLGRLVSFGTGMIGRFLLNAIAPPARPRLPSQKESPTLFIQGAQNRATPFGRVPKILGRHRFVPPFGAYPYTETVGSDQYLRMLFIWGYGPLHITDLKIGETPLSEFEGVEIETRNGYGDDTPVTLYSNSVLQNDLEIEATQVAGYILRTTEADADEIGVDITLPRGLVRFGEGGARQTAKVRIEVQYSPAGANDWSAGADDYKPFSARSLGIAAKPGAYKKGHAEYPVLRTDRIVIDGASGALSAIKGAEFRPDFDEGELEVPAIPAAKIALARIDRRSDETALALTDERDPLMVGVNFEDSGDFAVGEAMTANHVSVAAGGLQFPGIEISAKQTAALRETLTFKVDKGQYDVRVRRITVDADDDAKLFDETSWTALRSIRYAYPVKMQGLAMTALRIKATGQLNGVIDKFNGVVTSILPDWTGEEWVEQVTANPAALFRHVLQGSANARPLTDSRLDLNKIQDWHGRCASAGREFNMVVDYDISVREMLSSIAAAGRGSPALLDGKWGVVEDMEQLVPVQHFTPRNTFGFEGRKSFDDIPEALRIRFINRDKGFVQDERLVYDDGYDETNAFKYETLELPGVTSSAQAWQDGRYHIATARLRPETYSFNCDVENIVCTRGDLIRFSHDVPLFGLMSGRVKSLLTAGGNTTGVVLDAAVTMAAGKNYAIRFRLANGSSAVAPLSTISGTTKTVFFTTPLATGDGPQAGDLALFGEAGMESVELVVKAITPRNNLSARLTCVDAAPAVHTAGTGTIPLFSSQITLPPEFQRPPVPVLAEIQSGEEALIRNTDGSLSTRIVVTLEPPSFGAKLGLDVSIRALDETRFHLAEVTSQGNNRFSIGDVQEGEIYDIQVRYVNTGGVYSAPLLVSGQRVEGTSALPSDVTALNVNVLGDTAYLSWQAVSDLDLDHYNLRFSPQLAGAVWSSAVDIVSSIPRDASSVAVPAASGSYLLKAVDVGGRMGVNAALAVLDAADSGQNAILTLTESPAFSGAKTNAAQSDGALQLAGIDSIDDWGNIDETANIDAGVAGLCGEGMYEFGGNVDLGASYTSRLTADIAVSGIDLNASVDTWDNMDTVETIDQDVDPSLWSLQLQLRATNDNPDVSPVWSDWTPFVVGDYTARAFEFRTLMAAFAANITPSLSHLAVSVDMPDRMASGRSIASDAGGTDVAFASPFRDTPAITVTPRDLAAGDYYTVTAAAASGFHIRFYNSLGSGVARTFDYLARGYGEQA